MTDILILAGTCGGGPGGYEFGAFRMPDGSVRGVEDMADLISSHDPEGGASARRGGIARGLRQALAASGPLPRPFGLAVSVLDAGLDLLGGEGRPGVTLELRFADGATATIRTDAAGAAQIARDREVVRLAALRRAPALPAPERSVAGEPEVAVCGPEMQGPEMEGPDARALASIFAYEKRGGRLRRLADKARDGA